MIYKRGGGDTKTSASNNILITFATKSAKKRPIVQIRLKVEIK